MTTKSKKPDPAEVYARAVVSGDIDAPRYVILQCRDFLNTWDDKNLTYCINRKLLEKIYKITKVLRMAKGPKTGKSIYSALAGYQWLLITAVICTVRRDDKRKRRYERVLLEVSRKNGKAVSLDTPIPTPDGWKMMNDIHVGDSVFGKDGKPTTVIYESDVFTDKQMYAVQFEDGEVIKASEDHLWRVRSKTSVRTSMRVGKTGRHIGTGKRYFSGGWYNAFTSELAEKYMRPRRDGAGTEYMYRVPMNDPVEYSHKELPIHPYLLGAWLGDGGSSNNEITSSDIDIEEMLKNLSGLGYNNEIITHKDRASAIYIDIDHKGDHSDENSFRSKLKHLGVFNNKHIPEIYLTASIEQRMELLRGLMDTDGHCSKAGQCQFTQKSYRVALATAELIRSLGIKTNIKVKDAICNGKDAGTVFVLHFFTDKTFSCFKMKRKHNRLKNHLAERMQSKSIISVTPIGKEPCKCIMVDNEDHLYLCGSNFTVTHNTFLVAILFILLFYLEPAYSRFFSVAPDGQLAREIKEAIEPLIQTNIDIFEDGEFKVLRDYILHKPTKTKYTPLNYSTNRLDGKEPSVFLVDEVGALPTAYAIGAMRSGQLLVQNRLGFLISTKYPTSQNPFEDEVLYCKKVLDGLIDNEKVFSLLYEPDNTKDWATDDTILKHANPLALELKSVWNELVDSRRDAIEVESQRENFITKHCNIIYQGVGTESYISIEQVQACRTEHIDWSGRVVYVGVDLAMTSDNCSVVMCAVDEDENIISLPMVFIPEGRIDEKSRFEKFDYRNAIQKGECIACGDMTVDYGVIEDYVFGLEKKYDVSIQALGYDRYNCLSSAQKWEEKYNTVEVRQHSDTLHMPTKFLKEAILNRKFRYENNRLYEINFENARCTYDTGMRSYVNKKKSNGRVDATMATIDAIYLLQQDIIFGDDGFVIQTI